LRHAPERNTDNKEARILNIQKVLIALLMVAVAPLAWSQGTFRYGPDDRAGEWNLALKAVYLGSESVSGQNGSGIEIHDDWGFGFSLGYNFNNHFSLAGEMNFLDPRYDYTVVPDEPNPTPQTVSHTASIFNAMLTGTYNVLSGPITPFIDVTLGWRSLDSNVASGPPVTGCWWDPWWGYVCRNFWNTYSDSSLTYGGGVGVRWDFNRDMFLRASYSLMKSDTGSSADPTFDVGRIEIGWRY